MNSQQIFMLVLAIVTSVGTFFIQGLKSEYPFFPNWPAPVRLALATLLGVIVAGGTGVSTAAEYMTSIVSGVISALPTILLELLELMKSKSLKKIATDGLSRTLSVFVIAAAIAISTTGCAAIAAIIPILEDVIIVAQDAAEIIAIIQAAADVFFSSHPAPETQAKVNQAIIDCRAALDVAIRVSRGTKDLNEDSADAAFNEFRQAYASLLVLLKDAGVMTNDHAMRTSRGTVIVPAPLALGRVVHR